MELRTLHYFTTVAEELNITRAAERLNMSQPPLSKQIINLEEELGVRLFTRGKRHLSLTDAGIVFYRRAKQILDLCGISNCIAIVCKVTVVKFEAARKYVLWHIRMHGISVDN